MGQPLKPCSFVEVACNAVICMTATNTPSDEAIKTDKTKHAKLERCLITVCSLYVVKVRRSFLVGEDFFWANNKLELVAKSWFEKKKKGRND